MSDYPAGRGNRPDLAPRLRLAAFTAVVAGVVLLAAAAFALSYAGIHHIALQAGVTPTLARLYPLIFDAMLVIAGAATLALRGAGWWTRGYVWLCLLLLLAAAAGADAVHAMNITLPGQPARAAVAVTPWVLVLLGFGLWLVMLRHLRRLRAAGPAAARHTVLAAHPPPTPPDGLNAPRAPLAAIGSGATAPNDLPGTAPRPRQAEPTGYPEPAVPSGQDFTAGQYPGPGQQPGYPDAGQQAAGQYPAADDFAGHDPGADHYLAGGHAPSGVGYPADPAYPHEDYPPAGFPHFHDPTWNPEDTDPSLGTYVPTPHQPTQETDPQPTPANATPPHSQTPAPDTGDQPPPPPTGPGDPSIPFPAPVPHLDRLRSTPQPPSE
jgi:uncharacterized protein DUF2637